MYLCCVCFDRSASASSVSLLDSNGSVMYQTQYGDPKHQYKFHPEIRRPFIAFSPNGTVEVSVSCYLSLSLLT